jgi:FkbM family methyltransferase
MIDQKEKQAIIDLFPFMQENPVVIDGGSNKGGFSDVILEEYSGKCQLHLFEPNKMLLDFTKIKFEYEKGITYNELGISDKSGANEFFYFENYNNEISSFFQDDKGGWEGLPMKKGVVKTISIDEYCNQNKITNIDFLKLDIEGAEVLAISGCAKMLKEGAIKIIQIEYGGHYVRSNRKFQEVIDMVSVFGYKIYKYEIGNFWEVKDFKEDFSPENYYITKEEIHNYCISGSNDNFILNTFDLPKMALIGEWGAMEGITTKYICEKLLDIENKESRVIVIDPLNDFYVVDDPRYHPEFKHQYQRFKRNTRGLPVELKRGKTENELPKLNALRFDFIYSDGNHYSPWPYFDLCWSFAITKIGGYILADDYDMWAQETKDSIDKFLIEFQGHYEVVKQNYQILIQKTSNHYNSLTQSYY